MTQNAGGNERPAVFAFTADNLGFVLAQLEETIIGLDSNGSIVLASPRLRGFLGYEPASVVGRDVSDLVVAEDRGAIRAMISARDTSRRAVVRFLNTDGTSIPTNTQVRTSPDLQPLGGVLLTLAPALPKEAIEKELARQVAREDQLSRLATIFLRLPSDRFEEGIAAALGDLGMFDRVDRVTLWRTIGGDRLQRISEWVSPELVEDPGTIDRSTRLRISDLWPSDGAAQRPEFEVTDVAAMMDRPELRDALTRCGTRSFLASAMTIHTQLTGALTFEMVDPVIGFGGEKRSVIRAGAGILSEVFSRRLAEEALDHQARHDPLTGLANRWASLDALAASMSRLVGARGVGVAVAMIDIDRFKILNDWLGQHAGDDVLVEIAERFSKALESRGHVDRFGGDELLVVIDDIADVDAALTIAQQLQATLLRPIEVVGQLVSVTASIGVAFSKTSRVSPGEFVQRADAAMYRAKALGRDRIEVFDRTVFETSAERFVVQNELRSAIELSQMAVHFQPEVEADSERLTAFEALARWEHPRLGMIEAAQFLPLADADHSVAIGKYVLAAAVRQAERFREEGQLGVAIGVNLSPAEFFSDGLIETVSNCLASAEVPASAIRFEIDEDTLMTDPEASIVVLSQLSSLGANLAIDRFGTGATSLAYLRRFPVGSIRVSPDLVRGLNRHSHDAVLSGIVRLASTFGLLVTAVGIETEEQRLSASRIGCDRIQGFLVGNPVPAHGAA